MKNIHIHIFQTISSSPIVVAFLLICVMSLSSLSNGAVIESRNTSTKNPPIPSNLDGVRCLISFGKYLDRVPNQVYRSQAELDEALTTLVPNKNCSDLVNEIKYDEFNRDQRAAVQELLEYIQKRVLI